MSETKFKFEAVARFEEFPAKGRIIIAVSVEDMPCGEVVVMSGPVEDVRSVYEGRETMSEVGERWSAKTRSRRPTIKDRPAVSQAELDVLQDLAQRQAGR